MGRGFRRCGSVFVWAGWTPAAAPGWVLGPAGFRFHMATAPPRKPCDLGWGYYCLFAAGIIFIESLFDVSADFTVYRGVAPNSCMYTSAPPRVGGGSWDGASVDRGFG